MISWKIYVLKLNKRNTWEFGFSVAVVALVDYGGNPVVCAAVVCRTFVVDF